MDNEELDEGLDGLFIDFSEVQDLGPVPGQAWYDAEIIKATPGKSQSGHPKIDLHWQILDGEQAGRIVFDTLSLHPSALAFTKKKLLALGFDKNFKGALSPEDLIGLEASIYVVVQGSTNVDPETGEAYPPRNKITRIQRQ